MANKGKPNKNLDTRDNTVDIGSLLEPLSIVSRCLGMIALRLYYPRPKTDTEKIRILGSLGFNRNEIAQMLEISPPTVSVRLSERKIKSGGSRKSSGKN